MTKKQLFCIGCAKEVDVNKLRFVRVPKKDPKTGLILLKGQYEYKCPSCGVESVFNYDLVEEIKSYGK